MISLKDLFFGPHLSLDKISLFLDKIFPFLDEMFPFLGTFYVYDAKNVNTLQIMSRNCESLCQSVSQFHKNCESFLSPGQ